MRRLFISLLSCLLLLGPARAQSESPPAPESRPKNRAEKIAEKIEKDVEKIRGIELKTPVKIGVYDRATLKAFLLKSAEKELAPAKVDAQVRGLRALELVPAGFDYKKVILDIMNEQIAGFYDPDTKELRLIDRSAPDSAESKKSNAMEDLAATMMKSMGVDVDGVIMAHELTHALQDELIGLKKLPLEVEDDDDLATASKAVVEGDATAVMMAWTFTKMKMPAKMIFNPNMASKLDELGNLAAVPGAEAVSKAPEYVQQALIFPYLAGLKFCVTIDSKDKSFAATDDALRNPPLSTEQIMHPEKFGGDAPDFPMSITLPDLTATLGMTKITTNTLGELGTKIMLSEKIEKPAAAKAAEGWDGDRYALYGGKANEPDALVWLSTWDRPEDADEIEAALQVWLGKVNAGKESEPSDVTSARFVRADGTLDAVARKGQDVMLLRGVPKEKLIPLLQKLFEETKKVERRKV